MRNLVFCLVLATAPLTTNVFADEADYRDWQLRTLFQPGARDLARESAGRVHIYDGLKDSDIDRAMQTQFDRIGSMMFVRTVATEDTGAPLIDETTGIVVEDDDCD